jgi:hypothetical protein
VPSSCTESDERADGSVPGLAAGCPILLPDTIDRDRIPNEQVGETGEESAAREPVRCSVGYG